MHIQLKYVTLFTDKILWIDWYYDKNDKITSCICHMLGSTTMGTQSDVPNEICLNLELALELRQFLENTDKGKL